MAYLHNSKAYNKLDPFLQCVNKNFISLSYKEKKKTNPIPKHVIFAIRDGMKDVSPLFKNLFTEILYTGSYYEGLKINKPDEFDIDFVMVLPNSLQSQIELSNQSGFVTVKLNGTYDSLKFNGLKDLLDENCYLVTNKILSWMESIINQALNKFKSCNKYLIPYQRYNNIEVALRKSGPALTLQVNYQSISTDIDIVPVFKFSHDKWPPTPFRQLNSRKTDFMIIAKSPKVDMNKKERCWRLSFYEKEFYLIFDKRNLKSTLRMMKKFRDNQNHKQIASYFLKTIFLLELEKQPSNFWRKPQGFLFMHMLNVYKSYLDNYNIPYYWNKNYNLLQNIDRTTILNIKNFIEHVISSVDANINENPKIILNYLLTSEELRRVC